MTQATKKKQPAAPIEATDTMRIIKIDECQSLNKKSTLQFHVGADGKNDVHLRITGNDGGGIWTPYWISVKSVHAEFAHSGNRPLTSREFLPGLHGKSSNNFGFVTAALLHVGVIERAPEEEGKFVRADGKAFTAEVQKLIDSKVSIDVALPEKAAKKSPVSKPKKAKPTKPQKEEQATPTASSSIPSSLVLPGTLEPA